jgi:phosphopantothenoylcysteine decarboxylase/phosphopantothenate--cysteine ligase
MVESSNPMPNTNLAGRRILLGVSASIAAYKAAPLTRLLIKAGAEVQVILTEAAACFCYAPHVGYPLQKARPDGLFA